VPVVGDTAVASTSSVTKVVSLEPPPLVSGIVSVVAACVVTTDDDPGNSSPPVELPDPLSCSVGSGNDHKSQPQSVIESSTPVRILACIVIATAAHLPPPLTEE